MVTEEQMTQMSAIQWWHRIYLGKNHKGEKVFTPGLARHGQDDEDYASTRFGLPRDLKGKTVADIGGWDGYFSFEAEKRGARVTLFDVDPQSGGNWGEGRGFCFAKKVLASGVEFRNVSVYDLKPDEGLFDITLFFGVLYHLKAPLVGLEKLFAITKPGGFALIETKYFEEPADAAAWVFAPGYNNDPTNYFFPTLLGLMTALYAVGFTRVETLYDEKERVTVKALRPVS